MRTGWIESEWTRGRFFLLASLLTALHALGYLNLLPAMMKAVLCADVYALLVVMAYQERGARPYQLAAVGLVLAAIPLLGPAGLLPPAPAVFVVNGMEDWGQVLFLPAGIIISIGALLYARILLFSYPPTPTLRRRARPAPCRWTGPVALQRAVPSPSPVR